MRFVEWCGLFVIGDDTIDEQHRRLIEIANNFHRKAIDVPKAGVVFETLNQLINYAQEHFNREEEIAEKGGVPQELIDRHREIHNKLVEDVFMFNEKLSSGEDMEVEEIEQFLTDWLIMHILVEDRRFSEYLRR